MVTRHLRIFLFVLFVSLSAVGSALAANFYVSTTGSDPSGDGSIGNPWATISFALLNVPDGSVVLVKPGDYFGRVKLQGQFAQGVLVRSEVPYKAKLLHDDKAVTCYDGQGITLEGFEITHSTTSPSPLVIQIQDLIGPPGGADVVSRITLRDNIIHDSFNNDILKVNNGAEDIVIEGNMFYNQHGDDELIDINSVRNVVLQDNVFFNDFSGSGRSDDDTYSFIVIKDSNGNSDGILGVEDITVRRNVFMHWEGALCPLDEANCQAYVRAGEDTTANYEALDILIENNLMLGDNSQQIGSPFILQGVKDVTIRHNTVVGDMPAAEYGAWILTIPPNPTNDGVHLHNNIWSDPTGTMGDRFNRGNNTVNLTFDNNLFWNDGNVFPTSVESIIEVSDDINRVVADPLLGNPAGAVIPRWDGANSQFADGSLTIREVFENLVALYGTPASNSPAIDAADPSHAPNDDILGNVRPVGGDPDIGAFEFNGTPSGVGNVVPSVVERVNAYPNPFAAETSIAFRLRGEATVFVAVYNAAGQLVRRFDSEVLPAGDHVLRWNGLSDGGAPVASGVYMSVVRAGQSTSSLRLIRIR